MCDILKGKLEILDAYQYGRGGYTCDVCGQRDEAAAVPVFTVQGVDLTVCDSCLIAGPERIEEKMEAHIQKVNDDLQSYTEASQRFLSVLKKARLCTWEFPPIDDVRQARLQSDLDCLADHYGDTKDVEVAKAWGKSIAEAEMKWSEWPEVTGLEFKRKLFRTRKQIEADLFDDHPF
jgi:hypothetical protein